MMADKPGQDRSADTDLPEPIQIDPQELEPEPVPVPVDEEPLSLVDMDEPTDGKSGVKMLGAASMGAAHKATQFKRQPNVNGQGAVRCRIFHSRIAAAPLEYMEHQINEWIDNANIEIKQVGHVIGTMEGKTPEPNMIVMVWY